MVDNKAKIHNSFRQ